MKYAIAGSGFQGRACAYDLLQHDPACRVALADSSQASLDSAVAWLASDRVTATWVDVTDPDAVAAWVAGSAVLASCVPYFLNLALAEAAIAAGASYIDLGGNTDIVRQILDLHDAAVAAGVTLIPDCGLGPGLINTLATHAIEHLDQVDEIRIFDGGLPQHPQPPMGYALSFSVHGLLNEYVGTATALRDYQRVDVPGLSEVEEIELPPPLGRCQAGHAAGGLSTMAWTFAGKVRSMDNKLIRYPGHIPVINAMNAMGFFATESIEVDGVPVSPRALSGRLMEHHFASTDPRDLVVIHVVARGQRAGKPAEIVYDMIDYYDEEHGISAMMRTTGFSAAIVVQMLGTGVIQKKGAYPVELGVPTEPFLEAARERGFDIKWRISEG
jgi:lysine 6-dehydrogenase